MEPNDALKFLATLGIEYANDYMRDQKPGTQQALLARIELASVTLREALNAAATTGGGNGDPAD